MESLKQSNTMHYATQLQPTQTLSNASLACDLGPPASVFLAPGALHHTHSFLHKQELHWPVGRFVQHHVRSELTHVPLAPFAPAPIAHPVTFAQWLADAYHQLAGTIARYAP